MSLHPTTRLGRAVAFGCAALATVVPLTAAGAAGPITPGPVTVLATDVDLKLGNEIIDETAACGNGVDDDGDGAIDGADTGCDGPADTDETADGLQTGIAITGTLAEDGSVTVPADNIVFPTRTVDGPAGDVDVFITATEDATGTFDATTGETSIDVTLSIRLDGAFLGSNCRIEPVTVSLSTTNAQGAPYDESTGLATVADTTFAIPAAESCGFGTSSVNRELGLPSASGNNYAALEALVVQ